MLIAREGDTTTLGLKVSQFTKPPAMRPVNPKNPSRPAGVSIRTFCYLWAQMIQYKSTMYIL